MKKSSEKRGRPVTGLAMTPAEKQKAYRERQRTNQALQPEHQAVSHRVLDFAPWLDSLTSEQLKIVERALHIEKRLREFEQMNMLLSKDLLNERKRSEELQSKVWELEVELSKKTKKSNVTKIYKQVDIDD